MKPTPSLLFAGLILLAATAPATAGAADAAIATINARTILSDSQAAKQALAKFQADFLPRETELQALSAQLKKESDELETGATSLAPAERAARQKKFDDTAREFKRKQQQFVEDRDARKREDIQHVFAIANQAVKRVAEQSHIDMVFQDTVYASPKADITAQVIQIMDSEPGK